MAYRKSHEVVGYTYDAAAHCVECTHKRFAYQIAFVGIENWIGEQLDSEGNFVAPIFLDDTSENEPMYCDDCLALIG